MAHRRPARWLAPLALAGAAVAVLVTVSSVHGGGSSTNASSTPAVTHSTHTGTTTGGSASSTTTTTSQTTHRYYVVKDGDVLSAIAESTGVSLSTIEQLNPSVDAQSLHAGEKIKIAP